MVFIQLRHFFCSSEGSKDLFEVEEEPPQQLDDVDANVGVMSERNFKLLMKEYDVERLAPTDAKILEQIDNSFSVPGGIAARDITAKLAVLESHLFECDLRMRRNVLVDDPVRSQQLKDAKLKVANKWNTATREQASLQAELQEVRARDLREGRRNAIADSGPEKKKVILKLSVNISSDMYNQYNPKI